MQNKPISQNRSFGPFEKKMRADKQTSLAIAAARRNFKRFVAGDAGLIPEGTIQPVRHLPRFEDITRKPGPTAPLLAQTVVLKLNGGLGTSMGLSSPKSLLLAKDNLTFLDLIVEQILHLRRAHDTHLRFLLMNSFNTSTETLTALRKHPQIGDPTKLELMQSRAPKVDSATRLPTKCPANPEHEWYPPGHSDLYISLRTSGLLRQLLRDGVKYLFVSNADNLGARFDLQLLSYFADSGKPFLMEVCERTPVDNKGGHLARRSGRFILRESAQCPAADVPAFEDIRRHRFFNTNNLWIRLDHLAALLAKHKALIPLPLIKNEKPLDPGDKKSAKVVQLETAMGAAIQSFPDAGAIVVPRSRFAPVKTCTDLFAIRSDAYHLTPDWHIELHPDRRGRPPTLKLDPNHYWHFKQLEEALKNGVPSLRHCDELTVEGPVLFSSKNKFRGVVTLTNPSSVPTCLPAGVYANRKVLVPA